MSDQQKTIAHNSHAEIYTEAGIKYIRKTFRLALPRSEAEELRQQVLLQRQSFDNMRIPTSKLIDIDLIPNKDGEGFKLIITEVYAGSDFMDVVTDDNFTMYFNRLLDDIFRPLLTSTDQKYLSSGIDGVPRNFVYDGKRGEFCYVDFIPPKVFYKGRYVQEIPECPDQDFYNVRLLAHNDRAGIVYNFYINILRELPKQLGYVAGRLEQYLTEIKQGELFHYIAASPLYRAHDASQVKEVVSNIPDWKGTNFFLLREAANWLHNANPAWEEQKKEVYKLTSQERAINSPDYGRISTENFQAAKQLLINGAEQCLIN